MPSLMASLAARLSATLHYACVSKSLSYSRDIFHDRSFLFRFRVSFITGMISTGGFLAYSACMHTTCTQLCSPVPSLLLTRDVSLFHRHSHTGMSHLYQVGSQSLLALQSVTYPRLFLLFGTFVCAHLGLCPSSLPPFRTSLRLSPTVLPRRSLATGQLPGGQEGAMIDVLRFISRVATEQM